MSAFSYVFLSSHLLIHYQILAFFLTKLLKSEISAAVSKTFMEEKTRLILNLQHQFSIENYLGLSADILPEKLL